MAQTRILMILTSNARLGMYEGETGLLFDTFATPFYAFEDAGMAAEITTIGGGAPAIDPAGDDAQSVAMKRASDDTRLQEALKAAPALRQVQTLPYDAVFLAGGRGALWDFPASPELTVAIEQFALKGKPIAAVGHGAAALIPIMDKRSQPLTRDRDVACASNDEEAAEGFDGVVPFMLETKLSQLGARVSPAAKFEPRVAVDEFLVTGQNAASASGVAQALIEMVKGERIAA